MKQEGGELKQQRPRQVGEGRASAKAAPDAASSTKILFARLVEACKLKEAPTVRRLLEQRPELVLCHDKHHRNLLHYAAILVPGDRRQQQQQQDGDDEGEQEEEDELCLDDEADGGRAASGGGGGKRPRRGLLRRQASGAEEAAASVERRCLECFALLLDRCARCHSERALAKLWNQADLDGLTILHLAVISCNTLLVREILALERLGRGRNAVEEEAGGDQHAIERRDGPLARRLDKERHSPLHWAVITNSLLNVKLLIEHAGVQLAHQPDLNGATPLHYATQTSDYPKYREQLRQMLRNALGAQSQSGSTTIANDEAEGEQQQASESKPNEVQADGEVSKLRAGDSNKQLPAVAAKQQPQQQQHVLDILIYLTKLPGINLECRDRDARTPLLWAASSGNRQAIQVLRAAGANLACRDSNQLGALHCAASHGFTDCLECLLQLLAVADSADHTAAAAAGANASNNNNNQLRLAKQINLPDSLSCTPLFYAVLSGNIDCVELLLERGAQVDWRDVRGRTAAHFAALKSQLNILRLLEARGANLWLANKQGDLPLHYAIKSGRLQVVSWLLERSPYERAVNAINNAGRAPVHLAVLRNSAQLLEFLIRREANLNQLVKVRDKRQAQASSIGQRASLDAKSSDAAATTPTIVDGYRYETALDMARRMRASGSASASSRRCLELLEAAGAQTAREVLERRQSSSNNDAQLSGRALFERQTVEVASPIGFESTPTTSSLANTTAGSSSTEPPSSEPLLTELSQQQAPAPAGLPQPPGRPAALRSQLPQSDSAGSSALSQSSLTSVRGLPPVGGQREVKFASRERGEPLEEREGGGRRSSQREREPALESPVGPQRGGLKYHNDFMEASIKCKVYNQSFPPLDRGGGAAAAPARPSGRHQSASELAGGSQRAFVSTRTTTTAPPATKKQRHQRQEIITQVNVFTSPEAQQWRAGRRRGRGERAPPSDFRDAMLGSSSNSSSESSRTASNASATASDSEAATSETNFGAASEDEARYLPALGGRECDDELEAHRQRRHHHQLQPASNQQQQQQRFLPPSQGHTQHLPAILSAAEEERSTSGDTLLGDGPAALAPTPTPTQRARGPRTPELRAGSRAWQQQQLQQHQQRLDYSQVRAKVDSHRNDSGLSSHFGDATDLEQGRRSKSCSTANSSAAPSKLAHYNNGGHPRAPSVSPARGDADHNKQPELQRRRRHRSRSPQPRTIIRTRRLSVDSVELATSVEKALWRYKQETKLFGELQNLKRCQIRSGRANEALLVKRLIGQFRTGDAASPQRAGADLDSYTGPYTYKAYELYLYDQLRKLSQSNEAKLVGGRLAHKFTTPSGDSQRAQLNSERDYLEEDLRAELELQRVINGQPGPALNESSCARDPLGRSASSVAAYELQQELAIEPSGALEEIRVKGAGGEQRQLQRVEIQRASIHSLEREATTSGSSEAQEGDGGGGATGERAERPVSSASSSRRSSIDVEREKLERLPLRTLGESAGRAEHEESGSLHDEDDHDDDEKRRSLEQEARQLTAAIITDALGNVSRPPSRASSPTDRKQSEGPREEVGVEGNLSEDEACVVEEPVEGQPSGRGVRRRSVVNIGNKIEVVYHNVGIAIEPVAEGNRSDDDDDEGGGEGRAPAGDQQVPSGHQEENELEAPLASSGDQGQQAEPQELHERRQSSEAEATKVLGLEQAEVELDDLEAREVGQSMIDVSEKERVRGSSEEQNEEELVARDDGTPTSAAEAEDEGRDESESPGSLDLATKLRSEPLKVTASKSSAGLRARPIGVRRASSPPGVAVASKASQATSSKSSRTNGRHASLSEAPASGGGRVFTGHDLAGFRRGNLRRGQSLARQAEADETVVSEERQARGEASDGEKQQQQRAEQPKPKRPVAPRRFKCRLARSQPPPGPYIVEIPIGVVRERWRRIKRRERRRLLDANRLASQDSAAGLSHAKSQPNLKLRLERPKLDEPPSLAECSNFTLIYELNKRLKSTIAQQLGGGGGGGSASAAGTRWCRAKVARIVDVRALKRTLSLPESLMYSNDLLKRFNILKL